MTGRNTKVYVAVWAVFDENGRLTPTAVIWEDGTRYLIDRVLDVRPAAAARAGGQGDRYTVRINDHPHYLFFEHNAMPNKLTPGRWFVERK